MKIKHQNYLEVFHHQSQVDRYYIDDLVKIETCKLSDGHKSEKHKITGVLKSFDDTHIAIEDVDFDRIRLYRHEHIVSIQKVGDSE